MSKRVRTKESSDAESVPSVPYESEDSADDIEYDSLSAKEKAAFRAGMKYRANNPAAASVGVGGGGPAGGASAAAPVLATEAPPVLAAAVPPATAEGTPGRVRRAGSIGQVETWTGWPDSFYCVRDACGGRQMKGPKHDENNVKKFWCTKCYNEIGAE